MNIVKQVAKTAAELFRSEGRAVVPLNPTPKGTHLTKLEGGPFEVDQRGVEKCAKVFLWEHRKLPCVASGEGALIVSQLEGGKVYMGVGPLEEATGG